MTSIFHLPIQNYLRSYSALVDHWDADAGDSHEILGSREVLQERLRELTPPELAQMQSSDDQVLLLARVGGQIPGWDLQMIQQAAELIRGSRERQAA